MRDPAAGPLGWRVHLSLLLAVLLWWVLNHPLITIDWHDARIYAVLALRQIDPQAYARDPFFVFGSQDDFSLFSVIYAPLIENFGLRTAHTVVMCAGGLLWCISVLRLSFCCMSRTWLAGAAALALAALAFNYSPNGATFEINENFATARTLAFPLGVLALAECVLGRWQYAALIALGSVLLHPLLGLWPLAVSILWPLSWRMRWLLMLGSALFLAILMLGEVGPFERMTGEWWSIVYSLLDVCVHAPSDDAPLRWYQHGLTLMILLIAAWHLRLNAPSAASLYLLTALVASAGLCVAIIASWYWPSTLVIQAQLWRSMWIAYALVPVALAHLVGWSAGQIRLSEELERERAWWLLLAATLAYMLRDFALFAFLAWGVGLLAWRALQHRLSDATVRRYFARAAELGRNQWFPAAVIALLLSMLPGLWVDIMSLGWSFPSSFADSWPHVAGLLFRGGFGLGFGVIAWLCIRIGTRTMLLPLLLGASLLGALWHWDARSESIKTWESLASFGMQGGMRDLIQPGDVVLWGEHPPIRAWYELRTAHYASSPQAIGMVFSKEKTFELLERAKRIRAAWTHEHDGREWRVSAGEYDAFRYEVPVGKGIPVVCGDPELDWVVTSPPAGVPRFPGGVAFDYLDMAGKSTTLHVYRCSELRRTLASELRSDHDSHFNNMIAAPMGVAFL